jgi:hypothetical protein
MNPLFPAVASDDLIIRDRSSHAAELATRVDTRATVDLYWIPLGAGGRSVRFNGKVYEAVAATVARRPKRDIYHSALLIEMDGCCFAIEMTPIPDPRQSERGVVAEGSVGTRWAGHFRLFRYEVRRWCNGVIPDLDFATATIRLSDDDALARRVLDLLPSVPTPVWGRDELDAGEMWTCNSIISWTLARAGIDVGAIVLPISGRAPGWDAGITVAHRDLRSSALAHTG